MAIKTKAEFVQIIAALLASQKSPKISAADLRSFTTDLIDSLGFLTDIPTAIDGAPGSPRQPPELPEPTETTAL